jgi:aconitate hydratase
MPQVVYAQVGQAMGILPLRLPAEAHPDRLQLRPGDRIEVDAPEGTIGVRCAVPVRILRHDGRVETLTATAALETLLDVTLMRHGGVIPYILHRHLPRTEKAPT